MEAKDRIVLSEEEQESNYYIINLIKKLIYDLKLPRQPHRLNYWQMAHYNGINSVCDRIRI